MTKDVTKDKGSHSIVRQYTTNGTARRLPENNLATRLLRMGRSLRILDANSVDFLGTVGCEEKGLCRERDTRISGQDEAKRHRPVPTELAEISRTYFTTYPRLWGSI